MIEAMKQVVKEAVYHRGGYWIIPEKDFSSLCQAIAESNDLDIICQDLQEKTYTQAMRIAELEAKLAEAEKQERGETVAWMDGNELIVRFDWIGKLDWKESWVDVGRAIPNKWTPVLYTKPQQRTWVGLTDVEWMNIVNKDQAWFGQQPDEVAHEVAKLVEAKLKEKNT